MRDMRSVARSMGLLLPPLATAVSPKVRMGPLALSEVSIAAHLGRARGASEEASRSYRELLAENTQRWRDTELSVPYLLDVAGQHAVVRQQGTLNFYPPLPTKTHQNPIR